MRTRTPLSRRAHLAPALFLAVSLLGVFGAELVDPPLVAACSCAMKQTLKEYAGPDNAVFIGTTGRSDARGIPVLVDRWLWGVGADRRVWLSEDSFGDSAACGATRPPPGSRWIWIGWRPAGKTEFQSGLCMPAGDLATPEGRRMLAEAEAAFVDGIDVPPDPATDPTSPPAAAPQPDPAGESRDRAGLTILGILLAGAVVLFGGAVLIARRANGRG